jgi:hypothetical protein
MHMWLPIPTGGLHLGRPDRVGTLASLGIPSCGDTMWKCVDDLTEVFHRFM